MANIKMLITEGKGGVSYSFSYGYVDKNQELLYVENAVKATRTGDKWTFDFYMVAGQNQDQYQSYVKMLEKVTQVVDTNAMNLFGVTVEKGKTPAASSAE